MHLPTRFGLRAKLLTGAIVLLSFTAALVVLGVHDLHQARHESDVLYEQSVQPLALLGDVRAKLSDGRSITNNHLLESAPERKAEMQTWLKDDDAAIDKALASVRVTLAQDAGLSAKLGAVEQE